MDGREKRGKLLRSGEHNHISKKIIKEETKDNVTLKRPMTHYNKKHLSPALKISIARKVSPKATPNERMNGRTQKRRHH